MRIVLPFTLFLLVIIFNACEKQEPLDSILTSVDNNPLEAEGGCASSSLCIPPFQVDTNCVQMQMLLDEIAYTPIANYSCVVPNFILGIDQLWINGSIPFANEVVTLLMPLDIQPGTYPILNNTLYDAFYVPTIGADNFSGISGTLTIVEHDLSAKYILGGFEFIAKNLQSPVLPTVEFKEGCFLAHY